MVTFKVLPLCNEGIFLLNGASAGFPFERAVLARKRVGEKGKEGEIMGGWEGWLQAKKWKVYRHFKVMLHPIHL